MVTKPLGSGGVTTALDQGIAGAELEAKVVSVMGVLNRGASEAMTRAGASACTDVTGFGLLGHLHELARASGLSARMKSGRVPILDGALELADRGAISAGTRNNLKYLFDKTTWASEISEARRWLLCDAQTSGGLIIAVPPGKRIGCLVEGPPGQLWVEA